MGDFVEKAKEKAGGKYKEGLNCAESLVKTFDELCNLGIGEHIRMASGFAGGVGHKGEMCGALSGSLMILGAFKGRPNPPDGEREPIYNLGHDFHEKFEQAFGGTGCDEVRKFDWKTREQRINCLKLIANTAGLLAEFLIEKGLVKES